jgi:N-acylneuraminate cytidylyltransferase
MIILCLIPARSGSKGIPHKNIKILNNKPLMAHSIEQAKGTKYYKNNQMRIVVSTDSKEYADISKEYGAEVPILRPSEISQDLSSDFEFMKHMVDYLRINENYNPDIILQLRPTQPLRKIEDINKCLDLFIDNYENYDSLRTIVPYEKSPYKMYEIRNNELQPLFSNVIFNNQNIIEPYNQCRQLLPQTYLHNGYIDILKTSLINDGKISGNKIFPYLMNKNDTVDIDTLDDWNKYLINNNNSKNE